MNFKEFYIVESNAKNNIDEEIRGNRFNYISSPDQLVADLENIPALPVENFPAMEYADDVVRIGSLMLARGSVGEVRTFHYKRVEGKRVPIPMFGNYTMEEWYNFLKDIKTNGLKYPVTVTKDLSEIIEGNHRVQALFQLGYKKVPVEYR